MKVPSHTLIESPVHEIDTACFAPAVLRALLARGAVLESVFWSLPPSRVPASLTLRLPEDKTLFRPRAFCMRQVAQSGGLKKTNSFQ